MTEIGTMVNASGLYDVRAVTADAGGLTTGMRVKLTVVMDEADQALSVPVDAVSYDDGVPFVYCYADGIAVKTDIEAGIYDSEWLEVLSGLDESSRVITSWSNELVDQAEVLVAGEDAAGQAGGGCSCSGPDLMRTARPEQTRPVRPGKARHRRQTGRVKTDDCADKICGQAAGYGYPGA